MRSGLRDARSVGPRTAFPGMGAAPGVVKEPVSGGSVGPGLHQSTPSLRRRRWRRAQAMSEILGGHHVISVSSPSNCPGTCPLPHRCAFRKDRLLIVPETLVTTFRRDV